MLHSDIKEKKTAVKIGNGNLFDLVNGILKLHTFVISNKDQPYSLRPTDFLSKDYLYMCIVDCIAHN